MVSSSWVYLQFFGSFGDDFFSSFSRTLLSSSFYLLYLENVAIVKINPEAWSDPKVREVTIAWCRTFRTFHAFRACVLIAALLDENDFSLGKQLICIFNFLMDINWLRAMLVMFFIDKDRVAVIHRSPWPPIVFQVLCVMPGVLYYGSLFFIRIKSHREL
eukprot:gene26951-35359_t